MRSFKNLFIVIFILGSMQAMAQTDSTKRRTTGTGINGTEQQMQKQQSDSLDRMHHNGTGTHQSTKDSLDYKRNNHGKTSRTDDAPVKK